MTEGGRGRRREGRGQCIIHNTDPIASRGLLISMLPLLHHHHLPRLLIRQHQLRFAKMPHLLLQHRGLFFVSEFFPSQTLHLAV